MANKMVEFTPSKLRKFKTAYNKAVQSNQETFKWQGDEYVVGYAKYLIEYLEQQFK